jgi:hypothetical protein
MSALGLFYLQRLSQQIKEVTRIIFSALFVFVTLVAHGAATGKPDPEQCLSEAEAAYDKANRGRTAMSPRAVVPWHAGSQCTLAVASGGLRL